jgi:hypothetical protein
MTAAVALCGLVLGVLICAGGGREPRRTVLGLTVVLVSLLLAGAQSFPPSLSTLDARAAFPAPCGASCAFSVAPPAMRPSVSGGSVMPDRHRLRSASRAVVADPFVSGAQVRARLR